MEFIAAILLNAWELLEDSAIYVIFGILMGGLLKVFLPPGLVANHLGRGRFLPVIKAGLLGIPLPLCSCGVLPAAAALKKQGANNGATTAFLISTPESGVDSMAISYALLDPVLTVARPLAGFAAAAVSGTAENLISGKDKGRLSEPDRSCPVDGCCDGLDCPPEVHAKHHTFGQKISAGLRYAYEELWGDLAVLFILGLILAGVITALIPDRVMVDYLGGGLTSMLLMLVVSLPMYICATSSTPIAASLILKGASPGAALVFLLAGPATNITSLTVLTGILGKRGTVVYLLGVAGTAVLAGLALDWLYAGLNLDARAMVGTASELIPGWIRLPSAILLGALSIIPLWRSIKGRINNLRPARTEKLGPVSEKECLPGGT